MKALVISGGGSKGAFAGGVAEYLMKNRQKEYDLFVGTSTGSLLAPLLAVGDLELAKKVSLHFYYTPRLLTDQSFIFDPVQMIAWWAEGYQLFQTEKPVSYSITPE